MTNAALQITPATETTAPIGTIGSSDTPHSALRTPNLELLSDPAPLPPKKIRNGKIARLPFLERDMVNRMLRDHIPYEKIVGALEEHDIYVTERNISNWKTRGGYKEWAAEQDRALTNRLTQENLLAHLRKSEASQLPEIGLQIAATNLSQFFLKPETQQTLSSNPASCRQTIADLCRLSRHIHSLQKYRDETAKELGYDSHPERVRREEEKSCEITREVYSAADLGEFPHDDLIPRRNYIRKEQAPKLPPDPDAPARSAELLSLLMGAKTTPKKAA